MSAAPDAMATGGDPNATAEVEIVNPQGLHARPISLFVSTAGRFEATIQVTGPDGRSADGHSVFAMMTLAAGRGDVLALAARGPQAREAVDALVELVRGGFGEA